MTVRRKRLAILGFTLVAQIIFLYVISRNVVQGGFRKVERDLLESFGKVEELDATKNVQRVLGALNNSVENLNLQLADWAQWDDTCQFVVDQNEAYRKSNLQDNGLAAVRINLIVIANRDGRIVFSAAFDSAAGKSIPISEHLRPYLSPNGILLKHESPRSARAGLMMLPDRPILLASRPIVQSDGAGPVRGSMVFGRFLDNAEFHQLSAIIHLTIARQRADEKNLPEDFRQAAGALSAKTPIAVRAVDEKVIAGYTAVKDLLGRPALLLRVESPRTVHSHGKAAQRAIQEHGKTIQLSLVFSILSTGLLLGGAILFGERELGIAAARLSANCLALEQEVERRKTVEDRLIESKEEWEETFDTIDQVITVHDRQSTILQANKTASEKMFGLPQEEIVGRKCYQIYHGTDSPPEGCPSCQTLKTGRAAVFERQEPHLRKHLELQCLPRLDKAGQIIGLVHIVRDVTASKKAMEEHERLQSQLIQAQKMQTVGRLAGGVAHDFNNLLCVINGFADLALEEAEEGSPLRETLTTIRETGERATDLTRQLLAFSRTQVLEVKCVDVNAILRGLRKMLGRMIGEDVVVQIKADARLRSVLADARQLEQVVMNLAVNARDAMPAGGTLTLETRQLTLVDEEMGEGLRLSGEYVRLSVRDTGTGMSPEVQNHLFEPFFTTKESGKGTGLGLATVYGIVRQHNGYILVESRPGEGSALHVYLPAVTVTESAQEAVRQPEALSRGGETLLVAEDDPTVRELIGRILAPLGYNLILAASGPDALSRSAEFGGEIALLLSDVVMPGMDGPQLADELRARHPRLKVIFMSGYAEDILGPRILSEPGIVLLQKPLPPRKLSSKVREVLDG
ncbi:MAG: response regulator [Deltaproteobacteria bacterium]|nr:response regulator [Deltaproteobacteria bacterium]